MEIKKGKGIKGFNIIPDEVVLEIFSFLAPGEIYSKICLTCKRFYIIANTEQMFKYLSLIKSGLKTATIYSDVPNFVIKIKDERKTWKMTLRFFPLFYDELKEFYSVYYFPVTKKEDGSSVCYGSSVCSKFGGKPFLSKIFGQPVCGQCNNPMTLFLQINSDDVKKAGVSFKGLLQVFFCTSDNGCDNFEQDTDGAKIRVIENYENEEEIEFSQPKKEKLEYIPIFPTKVIKWEQRMELPQYFLDDLPKQEMIDDISYYEKDEEKVKKRKEVLSKIGDKELEKMMNLIESKSLESDDSDSGGSTGDKMLGNPHWIQDEEFGKCKICNKDMKYIFQIISEDNVPFMW